MAKATRLSRFLDSRDLLHGLGACFTRFCRERGLFQAPPYRPVNRLWVGLKGVTGSGKADNARTATNAVSEDYNECLDRSWSELSSC